MSKYQHWYDGIIDSARRRSMPSCYTEIHHILPRALGGNDFSGNLVRLTYREHFLAHWLLTKICVGADLRPMQRALFAMTMPLSGQRITTSWQFEAAKRAMRDLEMDPVQEAQWRKRYSELAAVKYAERWCSDYNRNREKPGSFLKNRALVESALVGDDSKDRSDLKRLATAFLKGTRGMRAKHLNRHIVASQTARKGTP